MSNLNPVMKNPFEYMAFIDAIALKIRQSNETDPDVIHDSIYGLVKGSSVMNDFDQAWDMVGMIRDWNPSLLSHAMDRVLEHGTEGQDLNHQMRWHAYYIIRIDLERKLEDLL